MVVLALLSALQQGCASSHLGSHTPERRGWEKVALKTWVRAGQYGQKPGTSAVPSRWDESAHLRVRLRSAMNLQKGRITYEQHL